MVGYSEEEPKINPEEVAAWKWMDMDAIAKAIVAQPDDYTAWFKIILIEYTTTLKKAMKRVKVSRKAHFLSCSPSVSKRLERWKRRPFGKCLTQLSRAQL